ncbi:hypothetical protein [Sulfurimonas sp. NWX79]|uniref:hypothetical protein n=1 Tax=Sulfurimonas sp. NWX79 TaxID=2925412 RepID=UPI0032048420
MKTIIKLTNEYASNLNALFFNFDSELASYYDMFDFIFRDCLLSNDKEIAKYEYSKIIDIVFIKMNNHPKFEDLEDLRTFIQSLRKENELLPVYLIKDNITDLKILEIIDECYCLDGLLPIPFDRNKVYRFLYRILKRLIIAKEINAYVEDLEMQVFSIPVNTVEKKEVTQSLQSKKRDKTREADIRFSQTDKISAADFMSFLDDNIIDKVENMEVELDALIGIVYRLEEANSSMSLSIVRESIVPIIEEVCRLVESIGYFAVAARAFGELNKFLLSLSENAFENEPAKKLFITMFLSVISDLEKWLQVIFIDHATEDIHYLDASFSSNILEIEQVFAEQNEEYDDEDDLEFF